MVMSKQRGLGAGGARAFELLVTKANSVATQSEQGVQKLPVDLIQRGKYQPRQEMTAAALQELADSIKAQGVIQPIIVRTIGNERYEIIAGERRWRASQLAGLTEIPVVIRNVPDEAAIAMALIENIQREDLNAIEEAQALQRLLDEFQLTHQQVAEAVGKSRAAVSNLLRLLSLSEEVKQMLARGEIEMGHARALLALSPMQQLALAKQVFAKALSVRETERLIRQQLQSLHKPAVAAKPISPDVHRLQRQLADQLGTQVKFVQGGKGKGKLVIHYNSLDELEGILSHIH